MPHVEYFMLFLCLSTTFLKDYSFFDFKQAKYSIKKAKEKPYQKIKNNVTGTFNAFIFRLNFFKI